jgi:beta-lactamase superfamily II metal-dependent hydrolase
VFEIDFLAVGEETKSGDAITLRFTRPDNGDLAHIVIDGGFQQTGDDVVAHIETYYKTDYVDLVVLTHPDGDHIGGLGTVLRELRVGTLVSHRPALHRGQTLRASDAVEELIELARTRNVVVNDAPWQGNHAFDRALLIAGPSEGFYETCIAEQLLEGKAAARATPGRLVEAMQRFSARVLSAFPIETAFDDAGGDNARNNSSMIIDLQLPDTRCVFTADAGVPAITEALDYLDAVGRTANQPALVQVPHHGSRHNLDRQTIERLLSGEAEPDYKGAMVSISRAAANDPRYPSPRVCNAFGRRGYSVITTAGDAKRYASADAPPRLGWGPVAPLPPMDESIDDR